MATRWSPSEVQCYAPTLEAGTYPLELSLNDQDYTDRRFPFLYFDDQVSYGVAPSEVIGNIKTAFEMFIDSPVRLTTATALCG